MSTQNTVATVAPALLAIASAADPKVAGAMQLAPLAIQALQSLSQLAQAGVMTPDQLAQMFAQIGQGIQTTHNAWKAMDEQAH